MEHYRFRNFSLDPRKMTLRQDGEIVSVEPQVYSLIFLLVSQHHRTVTKEEMREAVWGGRVVADSTFNSRIRSVRKVLGHNSDGDSLIKTIPHIGYRFTEEVSYVDDSEPESVPEASQPRKPKRRALFLVPFALAASLLLFIQLANTTDRPSKKSESVFNRNALITNEARQAYQRGKGLADKHTNESLILALEQYDIALEEDPSFSLAHAGKANVYFKLYSSQDLKDDELRKQMDDHMEKALKLDPDSTEVLSTAADIAFFHKRLEEALSYTNRVIRVSPNDSRALANKARIQEYLGDTDGALMTYQQALAIDPLSATILNDISRTQQIHGDVSEAYATAILNVKWNPDSPPAIDMASHLAWNNGDYAEAHRLLVLALSINPELDFAITDLIFMYDDIGLEDQAENIARSEVDHAFIAAINGDTGPATSILDNEPDSTFDIQDLSYFVGDFESAARLRKKSMQAMIGANTLYVKPGDGFWFAEACFIFRRVEDPIAEPVCEALLDYYHYRNAQDFALATDILGGIGWQLMNGDQESALEWLDLLIERNHAFVTLTRQPMFSALETNEDYQLRLARMHENATVHREKIRTLISNHR